MKLLRLANTLNPTSAPYNQFSLGFKDEIEQTFCSLLENELPVDNKVNGHHCRGSILNMFSTLKELIKENDFDVIHIHSGVTGLIFILAIFPFNLSLLKRTIFTLHNSWNVLKIRNQFLNFVVMLFSQKICTCGVSSRESIPRIINLFISKKTLPIVNGFDHQRVDRVKINTGKEKLFTNNSKMKIVCVGALNKTKNQIALLKVLKKIQLDAEVIFLGDGLNSAYLKHFSENISKPTEIIFKGRVSRDLAIEHMLEADISISVSKGEGLPIAVLESMYAGCFTILSAIPPHLEISPPEDRCYFVDLDNAEDIENSLDYVRNNLNTIRSSRDISKEYTMLNFSVKNMLKEYRKVYESLISCEK